MKGFEMEHRKRPPEVVQAIIEDDKVALSMMGKKGGQIAGELSKQRADLRDFYKAERLADAKAHAEATRPGWDDTYSPGPNE